MSSVRKPASHLQMSEDGQTVRCGQCGFYIGEVRKDFEGNDSVARVHMILFPGYEPKGDHFAMTNRGKKRIRHLRELAASGTAEESRRVFERFRSGDIKPFSRAPERASDTEVRYVMASPGGRGGTPLRADDGSGEIGAFRGKWPLEGGELVECASCETLNQVPHR